MNWHTSFRRDQEKNKTSHPFSPVVVMAELEHQQNGGCSVSSAPDSSGTVLCTTHLSLTFSNQGLYPLQVPGFLSVGGLCPGCRRNFAFLVEAAGVRSALVSLGLCIARSGG